MSAVMFPRKKAGIEAQMKAGDEEKAKRKQKYQEQSEQAAKKRRMEMEIAYKRQTMEKFLASRAAQTGRVTYAGTPETTDEHGNKVMDMFRKQIGDMKLLLQKKTAAYYQYSMQMYWDFMNKK